MKIKTISRSFEAETRGAKTEVRKVHKNTDPKLHPFEAAREVTRAITAAKMERIFAHPFLGSMGDHSDGVYCTATNPTSLVSFVSGAANGEVIVWDLASRMKLWSVMAHSGFVRGVCIANDGECFFSCGHDRTIKQWKLASDASLATEPSVIAAGGFKRSRAQMSKKKKPRRRRGDDDDDGGDFEEEEEEIQEDEHKETRLLMGRRPHGAVDEVPPMNVWNGKHGFNYIDHNWKSRTFATASVGIQVWDYARSEPIHSYEWGADSVSTVRFNPAEHSLLASTGADRSVVLYDVRTDSALRKVIMSMNSNALAWNPREPFNFTVANEDSNCYTYDMRKLDHALMVHKDHVGAVMDVHYSPTGKEFVTGSYDKTIRIWRADAGKSREIYHTKRMQRVFTVKFTGDAKYIISGSDDTNIRIWKANAAAPLGRLLPRERAKLDYMETLKKRYAHIPDVRRITHQRNVPRGILKGKEAKFVQEQKTRRRLSNIRAHTRPGSKEGVPDPERTRHIVAEVK